MEILLPTLISALTSLTVVVVTHILTSQREAKVKERHERERVNLEYLNPLRLYLVENFFRIREILNRATQEGGKCAALTYVTNPKDVSSQPGEWFNGEGCYLVSSCYLAACLFYQINRVRQDFPYLRLAHRDDTRLLSLMLKVSLGFLSDLGVFYVTQPSIGNDMNLPEQDRLLSYREFCEVLRSPEKRVWFDRLITWYVMAGEGKQLARAERVLTAIQELSSFLDDAVGGGMSIKDRLEAEGIKAI